MHGFGIFTSGSINTAAGTTPLRRYEGGWKHDVPSGFGVEIKLASGPDDASSRYYEGEWVDGMQQGRGIALRPDGRRCAPTQSQLLLSQHLPIHCVDGLSQ